MGSEVTHELYVQDKDGRKVIVMANDDDPFYKQTFSTRAEVAAFIEKLNAAANEAFGRDEWLEYECPVQGMDFDIRPVPVYGSKIQCSACGGEHVANDDICAVFSRDNERLTDVTDEWKRVK